MVYVERPTRVLIADDEPHVRALLEHWLTGAGYACTTAGSGTEALARLAEGEYTLLVTDLRMPGPSGMELLETLRKDRPDLAVVMVTAVDDRTTAIEALELGAFGYVIKPFEKNEILIAVASALERRRLSLLSRQYAQELEEQVRARTAELRQREEAIVLHLLSAAELRDDETGAHVRRIGFSAAVLAQALGWGGRAGDDLRLAAPMHDIGKIGVPDRILRKPGPLDPREADTMRLHAVFGARVLGDPKVPLLSLAAEIARSHHERWDGLGYPAGLAEEAIPVVGRLVAIVDVYDALTHDRVYRPAMPEDQALSLIREGRGTQFDPTVFDCFMDCLSQVRAIAREIPEANGR